MKEPEKNFSPGSDSAIKAGCVCPVMDNSQGKGAFKKSDGTPVFWYSVKCPIHGKADPVAPETILLDNKDD